MNFLLRLKNWQLFLITVLLPTIIILLKLSTVDLETYESSDFNDFVNPIAFLYYVVLILWNYRVTKTFNSSNEALTKKHLIRLDLLLTILIIYVLYIMTQGYLGISQFKIVQTLFWIFTFASIYAFFYIIFCTARTLKYIQLQNQIRSSDIIVEMLLIFYFLIGVWWLQRKVNKYYNEN